MEFLDKKILTVRIKKPENPNQWYAVLEGETMEVIRYGLSPYCFNAVSLRQININDCEILNK